MFDTSKHGGLHKLAKDQEIRQTCDFVQKRLIIRLSRVGKINYKSVNINSIKLLTFQHGILEFTCLQVHLYIIETQRLKNGYYCQEDRLLVR